MASTPPADAPMPTTGKEAFGTAFSSARRRTGREAGLEAATAGLTVLFTGAPSSCERGPAPADRGPDGILMFSTARLLTGCPSFTTTPSCDANLPADTRRG